MTNIVRNNDKEKYSVYSVYEKAFDGKGSWSFNDNFPRNPTIFGMYNSSSSHTDSLENDFFVLGKGDGSFCAPGKKNNFSKAKTKFCLSLHYNSDNTYLFVNDKEIYKFKANNKNFNFLPQFSLGSIPNKFDYDDSEKVCFKGNVYDFSVDYDAIDKSNILRIHKYLMIKSKVMYVWLLYF